MKYISLLFATALSAFGAVSGTPYSPVPFTLDSKSLSNIYSYVATNLPPSQTVYDTNAYSYITNASVVDLDAMQRINSFILDLKSYGLWSTNFDGVILRTNFWGTLKTLKGRYVTNNNVTFDGAGGHYNGSSSYTIAPMSISSTNTLMFIYSGDPNVSTAQSPFGAYNLAGTNFGAESVVSINSGEQRWTIACNGSAERSPDSGGFFMRSGISSGGGDFLWSQDPGNHIWTITWDNAGRLLSYIDGSGNLDNSGFVTRLTNGALNSLILGARLNASGIPELYAKVHVQAAFVFPFVMTSNQVFQVRSAAQWLIPGDTRILIVGDSMSAYNGYWSSTGTHPTNLWSSILVGQNAYGNYAGQSPNTEFTLLNLAVSGVQSSFFVNNSRLEAFGGPYKVGGPVKKLKAYIWIGINDIGQGNGAPAATVFTSVSNVWWIAKTKLGAEVTAFTLPPIGLTITNNSIYTNNPGFYTNRAQVAIYNALVRGARNQYSDLVDLGTAFPTNSMETYSSPLYTVEGLHMVAAGNSNAVACIKSPYRPGQYVGAFVGDGSGLTNLPTSGTATNVITNVCVQVFTIHTPEYKIGTATYSITFPASEQINSGGTYRIFSHIPWGYGNTNGKLIVGLTVTNAQSGFIQVFAQDTASADTVSFVSQGYSWTTNPVVQWFTNNIYWTNDLPGRWLSFSLLGPGGGNFTNSIWLRDASVVLY